MIQIGLLGSQGRMGKKVVSLLHSEFAQRATLTAQPQPGESLAPLLATDVIIDFSHPTAVTTFIEQWQSSFSDQPCPALIVGSTGWDPLKRTLLEELSRKTPVFMTANFSLGIALLTAMVRKFTPILHEFHYEPKIFETHHCHKKDAPSGTALALKEAILSQNLNTSVPIQSTRIGEVIGIHEVHFSSNEDQIQLNHRAQDRALYARGALEIALWIKQRTSTEPKILTMDDYCQERFREFNL